MTVRCESCGATNPDRASWCNQCLSDLRVPNLPGPVSSGGAHAIHEPRDVRLDEPGQRIRSTDAGVEWACEACAAWNLLEERTCRACGSPSPLSAAHARRTPHNLSTARVALLNALLPGLGHLLVGWIGSGLARLVLFAVWAVGGMLLLLGGGMPVALPLLLGAAALWALGLPDAVRAAEGRPQLLTGRVLLWLVVGVTLLSMLGAATVVVGAR